MQFIFIWVYAVAGKNNPQIVITDSETEVIPIQDDVVYNIQPDGRGGVTVKASDVNENNYTSNRTVGTNNQTNYNNSNVLDGPGRDYVIGYAPTPEEIAAQPYVPIYTVEEFQSLYPNTQPNYNNQPEYQGVNYAQNQGNYVQPNYNTYNAPTGTNYQGSPNGVIYVESSNGVASQGASSNGSNSQGTSSNGSNSQGTSSNGSNSQGTSSNGATTKDSNGGSGAAAVGDSTNTSEGGNSKKSGSDSKDKKSKKDKKKKNTESKKSDRDSDTVKSGVEKASELFYMLIIIYLL